METDIKSELPAFNYSYNFLNPSGSQTALGVRTGYEPVENAQRRARLLVFAEG
jgi:hypothetical protein